VATSLAQISDGRSPHKGLLPQLLTDDKLAGDTQQTMSELRRTAATLNSTLQSLDQAAARLPDMMERIERDLTDVSLVLMQSHKLLQETTELMAGLQRHWLLRSAFAESDAGLAGDSRLPADRLTAEDMLLEVPLP
jgi:hypothetical protein